MQVIKIHERDNVAVALEDLAPGQVIQIGKQRISVKQPVPKAHKIALDTLSKGQEVIKYGSPIGTAKHMIRTGQWIHSHNLGTRLNHTCSYCYEPENHQEPLQRKERTFYGYLRSSGQVGIRNEIWIIPTVGCVNKIGRKLAQAAAREVDGKLDGIYCFEHPYGCSQLGDDQEYTKNILLGLCRNPNAGGVLILGLGCENLNLDAIGQELAGIRGKVIRILNCQDIENEHAEGMNILKQMIHQVQSCRRTLQPVGHLKVGVKCGGSDGFSGITANPLVGRVSEFLISRGAALLMTEVPEMFGAERILMRRCKDQSVFEKLRTMIDDFKDYYIQNGQPVHENPSPGNKAGGITTLEEKSLGCIQKCGQAAITDVWPYGSQVTKQGLNLINGPGNDLVSTTALTAAGAQLILFTTGRGTPVGAPVPTLKIASNTDLAQKKKGWIDFDAGLLLKTGETELLKEQLITLMFQIIEGKKRTKNEENEIREFAIFKKGVIL